jgi:16S rRNA (guanine966-N2)-methyltransferase
VRIVAGTARGRRIVAPEGRTTRPTLDRVRQAIFNALEARDYVREAVVLDLFGGSGALGLEALSRGAASVTLVEADRAAVQVARDNAIGLGFGMQVRVIRSDVTRWLDGGGAMTLHPTLVLADPPYEWSAWPQLFSALPPSVACAVVETGGPMQEIVGWDVLRAQRYGGTVVTMLTPAPVAEQPAEPVDTVELPVVEAEA